MGPAEFGLLVCCARTQLSEEAARRVEGWLASPLDWDMLLGLAEEHGLVPLLYRSLHSLAPDRVPAAVLERLHAGYQANARRSLALLAEAARVLPELATQGIEALPYKGPVLADAIYGDVALREISDLDFLVDPGDVERATRALLALGYRREETMELRPAQARAVLAYGQHVRLVREDGRVVLELHWRPTSFLFAPRLRPLACWTRARIPAFGGRQLCLPGPEELLVLLCLHGYRHLFDSLKWVCDLAELARACPTLDYGRAETEAAKLGARRAVLVGALLAAELLEAPIGADLLAPREADCAAPGMAAEISRRLRSGKASSFGPVDALRDLRVHLRAVDGLRERVHFCLRRATPHSAQAIARLPLPARLLSVYWAAALASILQRTGAAAWVASARAAARLGGRGTPPPARP